jgi:acetylornithine deacetylase
LRPVEVLELLERLVSIDSVNPAFGGPGEGEIAEFVADWARDAGLDVEVEDAAPGRPNVTATARGSGGGKTLLLNGHLDTVGRDGTDEPRVQAGRLYGRGAYDMKGGLAACMTAVAAAGRLSLRGDVIFTGVVDEEYASLGTADLATRFHADGAIVAEFTELQLIMAHKGFVWLEVETRGTAAHGSRPDLGVDAISKMGGVLTGIEKLARDLASGRGHPLLGTGSVHASLIEGGRELSSYPERCVLSIERRTLPGESAQQAEAELSGILRDLERADPSFKAVVRRGLDRAPMETSPEAGIVTAIAGAAAGVLGRRAQIAGVPFWTDAAILTQAGIPSVLFGPSGAGAHAIEEWVDLASVQACADIYVATARDFCG